MSYHCVLRRKPYPLSREIFGLPLPPNQSARYLTTPTAFSVLVFLNLDYFLPYTTFSSAADFEHILLLLLSFRNSSGFHSSSVFLSASWECAFGPECSRSISFVHAFSYLTLTDLVLLRSLSASLLSSVYYYSHLSAWAVFIFCTYISL